MFPEQKLTGWHPQKALAHEQLARHIGQQLHDPFRAALLKLSKGYGRENLLEEVRNQLDPLLLEAEGCYVWADTYEPSYTLDRPGTYEKLCEAVCKVKDTIFITQAGVTFRGQWLIFSFGPELSHIPACLDRVYSLLRKHTGLQASTLPHTLQESFGSSRRGVWPPSSAQVTAWNLYWAKPSQHYRLDVDFAVEKG